MPMPAKGLKKPMWCVRGQIIIDEEQSHVNHFVRANSETEAKRIIMKQLRDRERGSQIYFTKCNAEKIPET